MRLHVFIGVSLVIFLEYVIGDIFNDQLKRESYFKHLDFIVNYTFQTDYLSIVEIVEDIDKSRSSVFVSEFLRYLYLGENN